jgi:hypothetical protein
VPAAVAGGGRSTCAATTVKVTDHMKFVINQYAQDAMRFSPGTVTVAPACSLTFEFATSGMKESHSLTIVKQSDLPTTAAQMENCKICQQIVAKHITHPGQPPGPTNPIAHWFVNVGRPGLDAPGDSIAIAEGKGTPPGHTRVTTPVSAPKGTILYFMCGLHPWMQGKIVVK